MEVAFAAVFTALVGGPVMWSLKRLDARNSSQHLAAQNTRHDIEVTLQRIEDKVDDASSLLANHIEWHAHGFPHKRGVNAR